jgi:GTPase SAR1 family protein
MQGERYDYAMKLIAVGDVGVGKTSIISRFITGQFNPNHDYTVGI